MSEGQEIIQEFLVESYENLDRLDREFVELEKNPQNREMLSGIFRTIHTIKGTCGFLGFSKLESVAHVGENLLSRMRDGEIMLDGEITTALLQTVDAVRSILSNIETSQCEGDADYLELIERLTKLCAGRSTTEVIAVDTLPTAAVEAESSVPPPVSESVTETVVDSTDALLEEEMRKTNAAFIAMAEQQAAGSQSDPVPAEIGGQNPSSLEIHAEGGESKSNSVAESTVRVDVGLLDRLMNLVGELVLARNQVLMCSSQRQDVTLGGISQNLNLITSELQEAVIKTRMQPIGNVWNKLPRVVRDLSKSCGKQVRVEMEGQETELDKTVLEAIKDPLTHIVRNSVDHGIEGPEERKKVGKPEQGVLKLRAFHEGGQVNIEISDDGAGIRLDKVKKKALAQGLISVEESSTLTDREATLLLFRPGFSTADKISNVSGRGVGMDVVKTNIEKIGGTVDMHSVAGDGTTLRIKIPLTLAIIPALVITSGGERFAIPQVNLLELVRLEGSDSGKRVEMIHGTPVYRLRGTILPLVYLNEQLGLPANTTNKDPICIVVLQASERQFGLVVDEINDSEEIVVKPLGKIFKSTTTYAGATIMGDGRAVLILDVMGLAQRANVISEGKDNSVHGAAAEDQDERSNKQTLLLFRIGESRRMAVPLSLVARLEEFPASAIEFSGDQKVVQYREQIMPLIALSEVLADRRTQPLMSKADSSAINQAIQVIVYSHGTHNVGLVVDRIVDVVEETIAIERAKFQAGVLGSAIIENKVTELLDIQGIVSSYLADPFPRAI
jgi:two-component system chemotaxis sensor kinase CheA